VSSEPSLDDLALRHGADKSSNVHGYARAYEPHLAPLRHEPITLLEIGVGSGASLRMWRDYFPRATLYGLDIRDCPDLAALGVTLFQGSQSDESLLERLIATTGPLDVVIDDGSHLWADQIASFRKLYPHLEPGGVYAIEDLHTSYWQQYNSGDEPALKFLCNLVDELNLHGKSGYGTLANDPEFAALEPDLNVYQRTIDCITFHKSLAFVRKKDRDQLPPEDTTR
jgi:hypothetical protein